MKKNIKTVLCSVVVFSCFTLLPVTAGAETILEKEASEAMKKATLFYYNEVSTEGGYLFEYTVDMKRRYGEMPARESQIWVQDPSTPQVGQVYLDAYEATDNSLYLEAADASARALIRGQLECGGWNYLIDFKDGDIEDWYQHEGNNPDFNEFSHFEGNATFDDGTTYGPTMLLMRFYDLTSYPAYLGPLEKALDFVLEAQLPLGGWSQRYPLVGTGYDTYYTFNDDVINSNIDLLLNAHHYLKKEKYLDAARRGADFIVISQHAGPQYGWGMQYTYDLKLAWGRAFEPPSLTPLVCITNVNSLMDIYDYTGDQQYLEPILKCLDWLDSVTSSNGTVGRFLEEGTNRQIAAMYVGDSGSYDSIQLTYDLSKAMGGYGFVTRNFSTTQERKRYASIISKPWQPKSETAPITGQEALNQAKTLELKVRSTIDALDEQGRWTEDGRMYSDRFCYKNVYEYVGPVIKKGWIRTRTFITNMKTLSQYLQLMKNGRQLSSVSSANVIEDFAITDNHPNPFNTETSIRFILPYDSAVNLNIYNAAGQKVRSLISETITAGTHSIVWDGKDDNGRVVSSGVYIAGLRSGTHGASHTMVLLK